MLDRPFAKRRHWMIVPLLALAGVSPADSQESAPSDPFIERCEGMAGTEGTEGPGAVLGIDTTRFTVGDAGEVRVCWVQRSARGRPVFGHSLVYADRSWLVQLDTLWHAGLLIETTAALRAGEATLAPGEYGVLAVPGAYEWVWILSSDVASYVARAPWESVAETAEATRVIGRSWAAPGYAEALTVTGLPIGATASDLVLHWERTAVRLPLASPRAASTCSFRGNPDQLAGRASPADSVIGRLGASPVKVCYGRPSARERVVFGGLVPFDDLWRTGANEPTVIHLPVAATIAGIEVGPGSYSILTVPSRHQWTVVVNGSTTQWGRVTPTAGGGRSQYSDAVRAREHGRALVPVEWSGDGSPAVETFTITAGEATGGFDLLLEWERARVRIPVRARP